MKRLARAGVWWFLVCQTALLAQTDTTPPTLTAFSFTPSVIDTSAASAKVTFNLALTDDLSGVAVIQINLVSPDNGVAQVRLNGKGALSFGRSADYSFPRYSQAGTWTVQGIWAWDEVGNFNYYDTRALAHAHFPTQLKVTSVSDTTAPQLTALSFPSKVDTSSGPATLTLSFSATDDLSGVEHINLYFIVPNQVPQFAQAAGHGRRRDSGTAVATFPRYTAAGTWNLQVELSDKAGNYRTLNAADLAGAGLPSQLTVTSSPSDTTPPHLAALTISPSTIDIGGGPATVTVGYTATDDLSGVAFIEVWFYEPNGGQAQHIASAQGNGQLSDTGAIEITFPRYCQPGNWTLTTVYVQDQAGNYKWLTAADLAAAGFPTQVTVNPPPETITIASLPSGLPFTADGQSYAAPAVFQWLLSSSHFVTFAPTIGVGTGIRDSFTNWADGSTANSRTIVVPDKATTFTANFATQYLMITTPNPVGGGKTLHNPSHSDGYYDSGTAVQLTAVPASNYFFTGFSGDLTGSVNPQTIVMNGRKTIVSNFAKIVDPVLSVALTNDLSRQAQPGPSVVAKVQITNSGLGSAVNTQITGITAQVLQPAGQTVTVRKSVPIQIGTLAAGASSLAVAVPLTVPGPVTKFVLTVVMTAQDNAGQTLTFTSSITIAR